MKDKIATLFDYIKNLCESDLDRIINYVLSIISINQQMPDRPSCPYCSNDHVIKYGHRKGKQRFLCQDCKKTFMNTTNTVMANSHFNPSIWAEFIRDTLYGETLDFSAKKYGFSHQTAFNMRHKVLMALQDQLVNNPVLISGIAEFDETYVLDCYKGSRLPENVTRDARKHGATAQKRGLSNEYVAICTGVQRDGGVIAATVNRAKPSSEELSTIFTGHLADDTLVLTDGLRSYNVLETIANCTVVDINHEEGRGMFNLNTANSLHSYIKATYNHYRGVATKYLNRYNALFSIAFRFTKDMKNNLFSSLCTVSNNCYWHSVGDVRTYQLVNL